MPITSTSRRDFLKSGLMGLGSVMLLPSCMKNYTPWQFLTEAEAACLIPICEQIIPADEYGPGATFAGVIFYIDKQLDEFFTWDREDYRKGIPAIQASAADLYGEKFQLLKGEQQFDFLQRMEKNDLPGSHWEGIVSPSALFRKIKDHCMQGFYGSPRHGGNKNYISYRLMKLDYPYIVGQNRYRELSNS